jgi:hypothetical protein
MEGMTMSEKVADVFIWNAERPYGTIVCGPFANEALAAQACQGLPYSGAEVVKRRVHGEPPVEKTSRRDESVAEVWTYGNFGCCPPNTLATTREALVDVLGYDSETIERVRIHGAPPDPDCQECEETPEADEVGRLLRKAQDNLKRNMPPRAIGNLIGAVEALAERVGRHQDGDAPE